MGLFSFFKKDKRSNYEASKDAVKAILNATTESVTAYKMMQEAEKKNDTPTKRNVVFQPEHMTIITNRNVMTKGVPADYFFEGDAYNKCAELPLLSPLRIDIEKAVRDGVSGKRPWEGSKCILVAENDEYYFYTYGCYPDGSGGCTVGQKKSDLKKVLFFGKARTNTCVFHNKLVQVNKTAYGTELYLFVKDIKSGKEKIYPWFGKYAIPTGTGSRYNQDTILDMRVDEDSDSIIINVERQYYINPSKNDDELLCNADTKYIMTIKPYKDSFQGVAEFPELNISVIFSDLEYEAKSHGISGNQLFEIRKMELENAKLKQKMQQEEFGKLQEPAKKVQQIYPNFDLKLEFQKPLFKELIHAGVDMQTTFELLNKDTLFKKKVIQDIVGQQSKTIDELFDIFKKSDDFLKKHQRELELKESEEELQKRADECGISLEYLKEIKQLERENSKAIVDERITTCKKQAEKAEKLQYEYPSFDIETELLNPLFKKLAFQGFDLKLIYEIVHFYDLYESIAVGESKTTMDFSKENLFCRMCGEKLPLDSKFCLHCGEKVIYKIE